jgi:diguanylate cyclase (GGDEF)-like protein
LAGDGTIEYTAESFRARSRKGQCKPCLVVTSGPQAGLVQELPVGVTVAGRDLEGSPLSFSDRGVSRRHAEISFDGEKVTLRDLGSTNGTYVNGRRISEEVEIQAGDHIVLSPHTGFHLTFQESEVSALLAALSSKAELDIATGLLHTEAFLGRVAVKDEASLAVLDIDQIGFVIEQHGHLVANQLLIQVAEMLKADLPNGALLGSFGSGFAIFYPIRALDSRDVAEALRQKVESSHLRIEGRSGVEFLRVTISVGLAQLRPPTATRVVLGRAEESLNLAKRMGRNRVEVHQAELWKSE